MGNRGESSGDGWKYRGRGLIQLTGRDNYEVFAESVGDDRMMDDADLVATECAVRCTVFSWDRNNLNRIADEDDVVALTRRIDGAQNALAHRKELLDTANDLLAMLYLKASETA